MNEHNIGSRGSIGNLVFVDKILNKSIGYFTTGDNSNVNMNRMVEGVAGNYMLSRGTKTVTAVATITTGMTTVVGCALTTVGCNATPAMEGTVLTHKISGGNVLCYRFRTDATAGTLAVGNVAGTVNWIAVGT